MNITYIINNFKTSCKAAKSEDDVKRELNIFIDKINEHYKLEIKSSNERTSIHGGRADSIYNDVIVELKKLKLFKNQEGVNESLWGRDAKDHGLYHYLINFSLDNCHNDDSLFINLLTSKVGVGFDGDKFIFCRFKKSDKSSPIDDGKTKKIPIRFKNKKFPVEFEASNILDFDNGVKRLLLYVRSTDRMQLTSENLCNVFSSSSEISKKAISYLYSLLKQNIEMNSRVRTLFDEWHRIFGKIYEKQETDFVKHVSAIKSLYEIEEVQSNDDVIKVLFVIQTYYSIIIKLIIQNLFASLKLPNAKTDSLKDIGEVREVFYGRKDLFDHYIDNFFEIHFFEWFTMLEDLDIKFINDILLELDKFETTVSILKPESVGDVLKKTYESLMPKDLRHLMGEYYTVEWLVDFTIENSGYKVGLDETVLDPTCGSCVFLTHTIKKYIERYKNILPRQELINKITNNFVGFDINPIAVIQGKGNYILSLGDITELEHPVSIPVYMCDSVMVPTVHAKQRKNSKSFDIETIVGKFSVPELGSRAKNDKYLRRLSNCILTDYKTHKDFLGALKNWDAIELSEEEISLSNILFNQIQSLHLSGKDGFWPIILKNSFAPLFCQQKFDYIFGNPPWIAWKAMSQSYRDLSLDIWLSYGIFEKSAYDKKTSHDDFAMAVTYVTIDHYLKEQGQACYVLPQTFIKGLKGGEGFRKFEITRDNQSLPIAIEEFHDMIEVNPFRGIAANKTAVYFFRKGKRMQYPMDKYFLYKIKPGEKIDSNDPYEEVRTKLISENLWAAPVQADDPRSPWLTMDEKMMRDSRLYLGGSNYKGRKGIEPCGAKGVYLVDIKEEKNGLIRIENLVERSRLQEVKDIGVRPGLIEKDCVYPMVGGRNIKSWGIDSYLYMIVPHSDSSISETKYGITDANLKTNLPRTYNWLFDNWHDILYETRCRSGKFFNPQKYPWYKLDNVGPYTFQPYHVLWAEQGTTIKCCVVSSIEDQYLGNKLVVTDSKILFVALDSEMEAYYLCGVINSEPVETIIKAYTISTNKGTDVVDKIGIPEFNETNPLQYKLATLSKCAHESFKNKDNADKLAEYVQEINKIIPLIFEENMNLKESTLEALKQMNEWADAQQVFNYMTKNGFFIGNSKTPDRSIGSVLYRYAEEKVIDKKKEDGMRLPVYKAKV